MASKKTENFEALHPRQAMAMGKPYPGVGTSRVPMKKGGLAHKGKMPSKSRGPGC